MQQCADNVAEMSILQQPPSLDAGGLDNVRCLAQQASRRDVSAFGELYKLYRPRLLHYVASRVPDWQDAEDLTNLSFEKAFAAIGHYQPTPAQFSTWLFAIAHNVVIDHYRKRRLALAPEPEHGLEPPDPHGGPEDHLEGCERRRLLHQAMLELTNEQRQVVGLRFFFNFSISEVAGVMGKTQGAVKGLQFRAFDRLREMLSDDMQTGS